MTPREMSNEQLIDALKAVPVWIVVKEVERRLLAMDGMIPRPTVDVQHSTEGLFLIVNGVSVVRIGWQTPSVCATLEKALGMEAT